MSMIMLITCDKCHDAIAGADYYHVVAPFVEWHLCQKCFYLLKDWVDKRETSIIGVKEEDKPE